MSLTNPGIDIDYDIFEEGGGCVISHNPAHLIDTYTLVISGQAGQQMLTLVAGVGSTIDSLEAAGAYAAWLNAYLGV